MKIIADAWKEEEKWLFKRRGYLSASDIFKVLTHEELVTMGWWREGWMAGDLEEIIELKLTGASPDFKDPVHVAWGREEEDHNRELFEDYSGIMTAECHYFIGNERWPYLATTLDGYSFVPEEWDSLARPEMFHKPEDVIKSIRALPSESRHLLEMKQSGEYSGKCWFDGYRNEPKDRQGRSKVTRGRFRAHPPTCPVYYLGQVQTQMALAGFEYNLAVVKRGASYMTSHTYKLSPNWLKILDAVNERVAEPIEKLRKDLTNASN